MKNDFFLILTQPWKLGIVVHVYNISTLEDDAGGLQVQGWLGNINLKVTYAVSEESKGKMPDMAVCTCNLRINSRQAWSI